MSDGADFPKAPLDRRRQAAFDATAYPDEATAWFSAALTPGTQEWHAYRSGRFPLGDDVMEHLAVFRLFPTAQRRRAYHRLIEGLLAAYEWEAARYVAKALRSETGECALLSYRHFFLWRILVGAIAGHAALGGSATWLAAARKLGEAPVSWLMVYCASVCLLLPLAWEMVLAPPHLWRRGKSVVQRVLTVSVTALVSTGVVAGIQYLVWRLLMNPCVPQEWNGLDHGGTLVAMASTSTLLGYVVTLFWRDRPLAGPG